MLYFQALLLTVCIQINLRANNHWPAIISFVLMNFLVQFAISLSLGSETIPVFVTAGINAAFAIPYFFLLGRTQGSSLYWPIMITGVFVFLGLVFFV